MNKCSPVEMRKNLKVVEVFRECGLDFVAIPVIDPDHKVKLVAMAQDILANTEVSDSKGKS